MGLAVRLSRALCNYKTFIICLNSLAFYKLRIIPALQSFCEQVSMGQCILRTRNTEAPGEWGLYSLSGHRAFLRLLMKSRHHGGTEEGLAQA